ncbi:hypothetical protein D1007_35940 [Hordeum vulgare]|nr:hypothetical protein D1007_35940 [Hordeum vulgare]
MFQSLGLGAIVSMIRKSNAREDGSAATCDESASAITQAGSSDYNPKDDEVIDGEEVDDKLVKKKGKQEQRKGEVLSALDIFKATHNSTKHGFSEDVQVSILIVAEVLTKHRPSSKFLKNIGLQPNSTDKSSKSNGVVNARVLDLQEQLEMSRQRSEVMREEMDAMKRKAAEAEAAQAGRDKTYELLLKKAEENDVKYAQLMALLGAKTGN